MSRALDDLSADFRPKAFELLARLTELGIAVMIIDTLRTPAEHQANLAKGVSWTPHSKHLDGDAIDLCPFQTWLIDGADKLQWNAGDPIWVRMGQVGESLGLRWGGRWKTPDLGHFELVRDALGQPTNYKRIV